MVELGRCEMRSNQIIFVLILIAIGTSISAAAFISEYQPKGGCDGGLCALGYLLTKVLNVIAAIFFLIHWTITIKGVSMLLSSRQRCLYYFGASLLISLIMFPKLETILTKEYIYFTIINFINVYGIVYFAIKAVREPVNELEK